MMEIDTEHLVDGMVDIVEGAHVIGERDVPEAGLRFGPGDVWIDGDRLVIGQESDEAQDFPDRLTRLMPGQDYVGDHDGAGIDEGVARDAPLMLELDDGVEGCPGGLPADTRPESIADL